MIKDIRELYSFEYNGTKLDISGFIPHIEKNNVKEAFDYLVRTKGIAPEDAKKLMIDTKKLLNEEESINNEAMDKNKGFFGTPIMSLEGNRGRHIDIFEDFVVITVSATVGSVLTGNATDGEKTIFYEDCIGIQYKPVGVTVGYLQLETASPSMNNKSSNFFNENTFTFGSNTPEVLKAYQYVFERVRDAKRGK